jgi:translocation and assembly module TamB
VRVAWLRELVVVPQLRWTLDSLVLDAHWQEGPVTFAVDGAASVDLGEDGSAQLSLNAKGAAEGMTIESARLAANQQDILRVSGQLPVVLRAFGSPRIAVNEKAAFAIDAQTLPNPEFWTRISETAGIEIVGPEAQARLQGTLAEPRGEATFRAERIVPTRGNGISWPRIEGLDLHLVGAHDGVRLDQFTVSVDGQLVRASGVLPVTGDAWRELIRDPRLIAQRGELRVEVPNADLSVVAQRMPAYLAPKGRLQVEVTLGGEELVRGALRVQDATLRPIGALGVVQEINAEVRFAGRTATIESLTGRMGGQLVTLQGRAELPVSGGPRMDFTLRGQNLPFVRRAGLLVRGDLDLTLTTPGGGAPRIGGVVHLRDSLFLTDVRALIPSGTRGGRSARPPYFSVPTPPLNRWGLDVAIEGERFLRLRTPVFVGVASARLRLGGTLGDPTASGEVIVNEGSVRLPFANFGVQQGQVRLTAEQLQPQIWLSATTRRYGYDLRMELTGPVTSPSLTFNSSPPLDSEQVLLLVMAGQPPKDEIATTESQRMARVGAFFGQSLLGSFSGDAGGADRLSITSGENVSEQGRETYNIEYRLNDRWALTGEYDEFDEYYAGLKWRFFEKGGEPKDEAE